ncbi:hypothetical protein THITH_13825 [Thioalkalivibrio paradoxus ARh 1]|uniref:Cadherin-like domain-containing protein n=1 Tax=Thioalkalivibrio paradoxus ARh 1 TaxID=713585 RepID=W0DNU0_9GAMM|nr:hypothetical protein THITH_13825 [Thioalkalivibrio paradoxus ARh 1]
MIDESDHTGGKTFVFENATAKEADSMREGVGARAFVTWELHDGSGRAPGIQVVTDDFAFPTQNCIMAAGESESDVITGAVVPKTCSDAQGSSKRFFLEVTEADVPVDLVLTTGVRTLRYKGVPSDDGGAAYERFRDEHGIGRVYRVLQKIINQTGERVVGFRAELGFGVGGEFRPASFDDDGVAFEMRPLVDREFFVGETGAKGVSVWNENRFATFSPRFFDDGTRARFDPGYFDTQPGGLFPPQDVEAGDKSQFIDSGAELTALGKRGAITDNYYDLPATQGAGANPPIHGNVFGYWLPEDIAVTVISEHTDGNPETRSDLPLAWWDGELWRYGVADNFGIVPESQLVQWADLPIGLDPTLPGDRRRYKDALSDDLSALSVDTYLYLGDRFVTYTDFDGGIPLAGMTRSETITLRLTLVSIAANTDSGSEDPDWVTVSEAPPLRSYMSATGTPMAINDSVRTTYPRAVEIDILANDVLDGALIPELSEADIAVSIVTAPTAGTVIVGGSDRVTYTPGTGFSGQDVFTYSVTVDGVASNVATVTVTVLPPPDPIAPVARNDSARAIESNPVTIAVLENDTLMNMPIQPVDIGGVKVADAPELGTAVVNPDNTITYRANAVPSADRIDQFTYTVSSAGGVESNKALVIVQILTLQEELNGDETEISRVGGCVSGSGKGRDPTLPILALLSLVYLVCRRPHPPRSGFSP